MSANVDRIQTCQYCSHACYSVKLVSCMSTEGDSRLMRLALLIRNLRLPFQCLPLVSIFRDVREILFKLMLLVTQENFTSVLLLKVPRV